MMQRPGDFCAQGVSIDDRMIEVTDQIRLRVITFYPPVQNNNPTILFIPGWITQMSAWGSVLREITKDFKVIYVETREKISSVARRKAEYGVSAIARDIVKLVEHFQFAEGQYVLFGSSLGATAIVESYLFIKTKPKAIILVNPNAVFRVPLTWKIIVTLFYPPLYAFIKPSVKWYLKNFRLDVRTDMEQYVKYCSALDGADPWKLKRAVLSVMRYEIWNKLENLDCPVLLVGASKDVLHEPELLKKMAQQIQSATTIDLGTNKNTHSEDVVKEMRMFLQRLPL